MNRGSRRLAALALGGLALVALGRWWWQPRAAAAEASSAEDDAMLERLATELDAQPRTDRRLHTLRWDLSGACTQVYAIAIDESFANESVALFLGRPEEHSRWLLAIGPHPRQEGRLAAMLVPEREPESAPPRVRELFSSPDARSLGPAAPDFACRNRSWDPIEDALALAWPALPDAPVRTGDRFVGQVVGGRCHETPCLDDTGQFDHSRSCQARPWDERLIGWLERDSGSAIAVLRSTWDDGAHSNSSESGILTSRELAIAEGLPLLARAEIEHRWTGVVRQVELRALDECVPGGDLAETIASVRASLPASG